MPLRLKVRNFECYLYVGLWNILDSNGESSITKFVNYWAADINKGGKEFADILRFRLRQKLDVLSNYYRMIGKWRQIFLLNRYDSIEETLKRVNLVKDY